MSDHLTAEPTPSARYICLVPNCDKSYSRARDLERHIVTHNTGPKDFDCPVAKCPRKGANGFWRSNKLRDHLIAKHGIDKTGRVIATEQVLFPSLAEYLHGESNDPTSYEMRNNVPVEKYPFAIPFVDRIMRERKTGLFSGYGRL